MSRFMARVEVHFPKDWTEKEMREWEPRGNWVFDLERKTATAWFNKVETWMPAVLDWSGK